MTYSSVPADPADPAGIDDHAADADAPAWALQAGEALLQGLSGRVPGALPALLSAIPVAVPAAAPRPAAKVEWAGRAAVLAGLRLLVVGAASVRGAAIEGGAAAGLRIDAAADAPEAVRALRQAVASRERYDAVLLDADLPGVDPIACAAQLLRAARGAAAMVLLAAPGGDAALRRRVVASGVRIGAVLPAPLTPTSLVDACLGVGGLGGAAPTVEAGARGGPEASFAGRRILLVDDNPIDAELTIHWLQDAGLAVAWAHDALEALAVLEAEPFDAVLMDSRLPGMDGYEAARAIRGRFDRTTLPVIGLSADGMVADRDRAWAAGMNGEVGKPVDPDALFALLARWLGPRT